MKTYLVGGAVRDSLLGLDGYDRDWVVVGATPQALEELGYRPVGRDFPVFLHPNTREEYALARTERKSGKGYKGFTVYATPDVTLEEDLQRRDLTINAMAMDESGQLIDPWGGSKDLQDRILRHVSPAFAEDPLRILRVARFAARLAPLGFQIAEETMQLMRAMVTDGELAHLVAERVWRELQSALAEPGAAEFCRVLRACNALKDILPEVDRLFGVPQPEQWHPEIDTGEHTLMALEQACLLSTDTTVRFAALMHDVGKALTPPGEWPRHIAHEQRGLRLIEQACKRLRAPNDYRELASISCQFHTHCHQAMVLKPSTLLKTLESVDAFRRPQRFANFLMVCIADARGRTGLEDSAYPQADLFRVCFTAANAVNVPQLIAELGTDAASQGEQIRQHLHRARLQAITDTIHRVRPA
jgi:tRNA nucleotidyltransferase (CCA-adding enzyme)